MPRHYVCRHESSRVITAQGMTHRICNACGSPLESPQLRNSFKVSHSEVKAEKMAERLHSVMSPKALGVVP